MNRFARTNVRFAVWMLTLAVLIGLSDHWTASLRGQEAEAPEAAAEGNAAEQDAAEQDAAEQLANVPEDSEAKATAEEEEDSLGAVVLKSIQSNWFGLAFYVVLGIFSVVTMAVALERLVRLRHSVVIPKRFVRSLNDLLASGEATADNLRKLCDGWSSPISGILRAGLSRAGRPLVEVEKAMEDATIREMGGMRARNRPLSVIGNVAPLVGLLGTVVGMIFAFKISSQTGLGKAELLAEGIYLALLTTAAGLTIAIPCLLLVAWFNAKAERFVREIDEILLETMPSFGRMENYTHAPARPSPEAETATSRNI